MFYDRLITLVMQWGDALIFKVYFSISINIFNVYFLLMELPKRVRKKEKNNKKIEVSEIR